ncbi:MULTISPECIES: hypothetical protein [Rhodopirellula]|uniref:hypothetical protein n=1 Tax=Rhodopirellula TaxID=265488 RepID=UPI00257E513E|nr:hypothetical protein [Rhodopirellula sp. UBA1907]
MKPFGRVGLFAAILFGVLVGVAPNPCFAQNQINLAQFDSWIFQRHGRDEARCRSNLKKEIELQFVRIEQSTPLSESQKDALRLAGQGDIKRFFDRVNDAREKFLQLEQTNNNHDVTEAYQLASPLQRELTEGLFGEGSLMQKVTHYVMTEEQTVEFQERRIEQFRTEMEAKGKVFLATMGRSMALTARQQRQLQAHFRNKAQQIEKVIPTNQQPRFNQYLFITWISEMKNEEDISFLDEEQMQLIEKLAERARAIRPMLEQQGLIE